MFGDREVFVDPAVFIRTVMSLVPFVDKVIENVMGKGVGTSSMIEQLLSLRRSPRMIIF